MIRVSVTALLLGACAVPDTSGFKSATDTLATTVAAERGAYFERISGWEKRYSQACYDAVLEDLEMVAIEGKPGEEEPILLANARRYSVGLKDFGQGAKEYGDAMARLATETEKTEENALKVVGSLNTLLTGLNFATAGLTSTAVETGARVIAQLEIARVTAEMKVLVQESHYAINCAVEEATPLYGVPPRPDPDETRVSGDGTIVEIAFRAIRKRRDEIVTELTDGIDGMPEQEDAQSTGENPEIPDFKHTYAAITIARLERELDRCEIGETQVGLYEELVDDLYGRDSNGKASLASPMAFYWTAKACLVDWTRGICGNLASDYEARYESLNGLTGEDAFAAIVEKEGRAIALIAELKGPYDAFVAAEAERKTWVEDRRKGEQAIAAAIAGWRNAHDALYQDATYNRLNDVFGDDLPLAPTECVAKPVDDEAEGAS